MLNALISQQLSRAARREVRAIVSSNHSSILDLNLNSFSFPPPHQAEGSSWVYVDDYQLNPTSTSYNVVRNNYDRIGKALWNAIRRQQMSALALNDAKKRNEQQSRKDY